MIEKQQQIETKLAGKMSSSLLAELKKTFIVRIALSYSFIMSGFIVNFLQLLTFIFVWPFNKLLYRKIIYYLSYSLYSSMSNFSRYTNILGEIKCIITVFKMLPRCPIGGVAQILKYMRAMKMRRCSVVRIASL